MLGMREKRFGIALFNDFALMENQAFMAHAADDREIMADKEIAKPPPLLNFL